MKQRARSDLTHIGRSPENTYRAPTELVANGVIGSFWGRQATAQRYEASDFAAPGLQTLDETQCRHVVDACETVRGAPQLCNRLQKAFTTDWKGFHNGLQKAAPMAHTWVHTDFVHNANSRCSCSDVQLLNGGRHVTGGDLRTILKTQTHDVQHKSALPCGAFRERRRRPRARAWLRAAD